MRSGAPAESLPGGDEAAAAAAARQEVTQLRAAIARRAILDTACGVVMAVGRCTAEEALRTLTATAAETGREVEEVARLLVEGIGAPSPADAVRDVLGRALTHIARSRREHEGT